MGNEAWEAYISCLVEQLKDALQFDGFGDELSSSGDSKATVAAWAFVCDSLSVPATLWLANTGAQTIEIACNDKSTAGHPITANTWRVIDRFKGRLYARSTAGASTLSWYLMPLNMSGPPK